MNIQDLIHRLEEGRGIKFARIGLAVLAFLLFAVGYNSRAFKNMASMEAMDSAQLARNIAEGRGYTTSFVRPFSMFLVKRQNEAKGAHATLGTSHDLARIKEAHPDISNPPLYPVFLAGLMKVMPFRYEIPDKPQPFWFFQGKFWRHQPDFLISLVNQLLLVGVAVLAFFIGRRLFDAAVGWMSAILVLGTELLWRFSVSGLSTTFLMLLFMLLVWCLVRLEQEGREPTWALPKMLLLAAAAGALAGAGALTKYSFAWVVIPVLLFIGFFGGPRRWACLTVAAVVFLALFAPWIVRNISVSGTPFGTATYAILENTGLFPEFKLQRSLTPDLNQPVLGVFWTKLIVGLREIVAQLPALGGTWLTAFFLAGLMIRFRNPAVSRMRYFILVSMVLLGISQALTRTFISEEAKGLTTENMLILFVPLLIVYGSSLFFMLLDRIQFPVAQLRLAAIGLFGVLACLPMLLTFMPPKTIPVAWPPYYPPAIQTLGTWLKPDELAMSDVPWAMAWYGHRQTVWHTLNSKSDFLAINDYMKPINLLLLTHVTLDSKFLSNWLRAGQGSWGTLLLESLLKNQVPDYFPLRKTQSGWWPDQFVVTDWERWNRPGVKK